MSYTIAMVSESFYRETFYFKPENYAEPVEEAARTYMRLLEWAGATTLRAYGIRTEAQLAVPSQDDFDFLHSVSVVFLPHPFIGGDSSIQFNDNLMRDLRDWVNASSPNVNEPNPNDYIAKKTPHHMTYAKSFFVGGKS